MLSLTNCFDKINKWGSAAPERLYYRKFRWRTNPKQQDYYAHLLVCNTEAEVKNGQIPGYGIILPMVQNPWVWDYSIVPTYDYECTICNPNV